MTRCITTILLALTLVTSQSAGQLVDTVFAQYQTQVNRSVDRGLAYLAAALGVIHYYMRVKQDTREPLIYGAILAVLLGIRLVNWLRSQSTK